MKANLRTGHIQFLSFVLSLWYMFAVVLHNDMKYKERLILRSIERNFQMNVMPTALAKVYVTVQIYSSRFALYLMKIIFYAKSLAYSNF